MKVNIILKSGVRETVDMSAEMFDELSRNIGTGKLIFKTGDISVSTAEVAMIRVLEPEREHHGC